MSHEPQNTKQIVSTQADGYFKEIREAISLYPDNEAIYGRYLSIFYRVTAENTRFSTIQFGGAYARTSYLLKEHGATPKQAWEVNDMRVRLNKYADTIDKQKIANILAENVFYDFATISRFVSIIYGCIIPTDLLKIMPEARESVRAHQSIPESDVIRMIADRCDNDYIYGKADDSGQELKVSFSGRFGSEDSMDFSYLRQCIVEGSILNLVKPSYKEGVVCTDFIIFEPDYLVNASEVASCFRPYAVSHYQQLIDRLKPEACTEAILLGNFTGQLLDEEINGDGCGIPYNESVKKFFKSYAFGLVSTPIQPDFHDKAKKQKININKTFAELPKVVKTYDKDKAVLEPTYFSPMLGIQGRVDLMTLDHSFLVEQKSGNSAFPYPTNPNQRPRPQESHYVQMLLYMMIMRYNYPKLYAANRGISSFLLYSKYPVSLCGLGWAPRMEYEAIKIRNMIAKANFVYAEKGVGVLNRISPESLRKRIVSDKLWDKYSRPEISGVLLPVQSSTGVERKYFHRMMRFVALEHLISKVGSNGIDQHGMASMWLNPLEVKIQNGNIYTAMQLVSPNAKHKGSVDKVVLSFAADADNSMSNFRKGDIVVLYPYASGATPDASHSMILRCSISDMTSETIELRLHAPQSSPRIFMYFSECMWAIEHDFMESSFAPLYRGLHSLLSTNKERRDLLLLQRPPKYDASLAIKGNYGEFDNLAIRVKQARDFFLIIGPPGTGKTSYGMLYTLKEELTEASASVMVTAYTNRAVDEICSKLVAEGIDFIRIGSSVSADPRYANYMLDRKTDSCNNLQKLRLMLKETKVIVGTTAAFCRNIAIFGMKRFSLAIIDEASQILEPQILPILTAKHAQDMAVSKFVMIGDHKQLPAVVQQRKEESAVADADLNGIGLYDCSLSLFERLLRRYGDDPSVAYMLTRQGRMHREIADFVSNTFYNGLLNVVPLKHQVSELPKKTAQDEFSSLLSRRMTFFSVTAQTHPECASEKVNVKEAELIAAAVKEIYKAYGERFSVSETLGVIVPYRNQIVAIRKAIDHYNIPHLSDISIDTVERYQGSQRDIIIYGFTVRHKYQLDFLTSTSFVENGETIDRKLNVAMTRAKEHLILVGDHTVLSLDPIHKKLIDYLKEKDCFF